ncbi:hypothetical protein KBY99_03595 [Cyanobium sp. Maggiore-St4-Cus]|jgi:hypothetical protein|uniref:hypothetical protein n=1 Tax=unclassified Cyanobium TaxID=2627006 RepID=UPI0020CDC2F5|nr:MULTISPECIES: hypothetical protein [unclassified Cyanobium]MCP9788064.1 hypothetical protein [Cyanobium sp. Maggiore-St4-Cus]MCP9822039.1 hypothetical protein [Cyanobium sp. L1E-Cus]
MTTLVRHDLSDPAIPEGMVRISAGAEHRFIWPVHLGGWQSLGWQLQEAAAELPVAPTVAIDLTAPLAPEPEEVAQPLPAVEPEALPEAQLEPEPEPAAEPELVPVPAPDFQAMTKAQILEHCYSVYGVELDGSQTKAELVEQATALAQQPVEQPLPDLLLDDPLI